MAQSYYAIMLAKPGTLLLGAKNRVQSSRFETREQANAWLEAMTQHNTGTCSVHISKRAPEITLAETEPDSEPSEPEEGDITTEDHETFYQYGRVVLEPYCKPGDAVSLWFGYDHGKQFQIRTEPDDHVAAIRAYMDRVQFWPNVWCISDHGNAHLMDLSEGK